MSQFEFAPDDPGFRRTSLRPSKADAMADAPAVTANATFTRTFPLFLLHSFSAHWPCCLPSDAVASDPPRPIVSTADDGTITIEPRSLIAS